MSIHTNLTSLSTEFGEDLFKKEKEVVQTEEVTVIFQLPNGEDKQFKVRKNFII